MREYHNELPRRTPPKVGKSQGAACRRREGVGLGRLALHESPWAGDQESGCPIAFSRPLVRQPHCHSIRQRDPATERPDSTLNPVGGIAGSFGVRPASLKTSCHELLVGAARWNKLNLGF